MNIIKYIQSVIVKKYNECTYKLEFEKVSWRIPIHEEFYSAAVTGDDYYDTCEVYDYKINSNILYTSIMVKYKSTSMSDIIGTYYVMSKDVLYEVCSYDPDMNDFPDEDYYHLEKLTYKNQTIDLTKNKKYNAFCKINELYNAIDKEKSAIDKKYSGPHLFGTTYKKI